MQNWGLVRTVTRETIDALASGGSTEGLDEEEVASSVLSEVLGATQGFHFVRSMRDAAAAGLVSPVVRARECPGSLVLVHVHPPAAERDAEFVAQPPGERDGLR